MMILDARRSSTTALRNREPILDVLREVLPPVGTVMEIVSGSGEHAVHFARGLPDLIWQSSDPSAEARSSITGWIISDGPPSILLPLEIDAAAAEWPLPTPSSPSIWSTSALGPRPSDC